MKTYHKCAKCQGYEDQRHNYCRMCGANFKKGLVKNVRIAITYYTNEKYCGYCGQERKTCTC